MQIVGGGAIIAELWEEGQCSFDGAHYHLQDASLSLRPIQDPRPSVLIGGKVTNESGQ